MATVGTRLRRFRKNKKLTQGELAKLINKTTRMVQKYESDEVVPPWDVIKNLANILDVDMADLIIYADEAFDSIDNTGYTVKFRLPNHDKEKSPQGITSYKHVSVAEAIRRTYDLRYLLENQQQEAYFNGRVLTKRERRQVYNILKALFQEERKELSE